MYGPSTVTEDRNAQDFFEAACSLLVWDRLASQRQYLTGRESDSQSWGKSGKGDGILRMQEVRTCQKRHEVKALQFVAAATPAADSKNIVCTAFLLTSDGDIPRLWLRIFATFC